MAVGDNYNDREMLDYAGTGVAMGNSVVELLDGAFHVTGSNDEAGLAQAIEVACSGASRTRDRLCPVVGINRQWAASGRESPAQLVRVAMAPGGRV